MTLGTRRASQVQFLTGPLRQRLTALPPPLKGEAGWVVQVTSVGNAHARDSSLHFVPLRMTK